jgi:uncharacterized glyoxalase superfamily protein PhnB
MSDESPAGAERRAQPESFRARALRASLTVADLPKSLAWYTDVLGFTLQQRREAEGKLVAAALVAGSVRLLLNQDNGARGWDRQKGEGFSLMLTTAQDIDTLAARIRDAGGTLDSEPADMPWGARVFRIRDPDGYRFAISTE